MERRYVFRPLAWTAVRPVRRMLAPNRWFLLEVRVSVPMRKRITTGRQQVVNAL